MPHLYSPDLLSANKEDIYYTLTMFPYPSGYGLHVGHASVFTINDVNARYQRMKGKIVLNPFGFDSFGLPTENYAMQQGKPAWQVTKENGEFFLKQLEALDMSFDQERLFFTSDPDYYKWTQWIFLKLYEAGLVYRAEKFVNRCPGCQTVLANDQVVDGLCERCKSEIIQKKHPQWFIKITDYADRLIADLDTIDRPEETKLAQKNWIGKSVGAEIDFIVSSTKITVFTTRSDTVYGVTAIVLAPENTIIDEYLSDTSKEKVIAYRKESMAKTAVQRQQDSKEKSGVFSGIFAVHPLTGEQIPVWFADYVLMDYGTGAVMFVPAHDERDYYFWESNSELKYNYPLKTVIIPVSTNDVEGKYFPTYAHTVGENENIFEVQKRFTETTAYNAILNSEYGYSGLGILINSSQFNGLDNISAKKAITTHLESIGAGKAKITYRLRDWSVSRQRYWGSPIPMYYDEHNTPHPIPESELPVILPRDIQNYKPKGKSPLEDHESFPIYIPNAYQVPFFKYAHGIVAVREDKETLSRNRVLAIVQNTVTKKYLCIRYTKNNGLSCPTGGIDAGETMEETVRREVYEETGIYDVQSLKNTGVEFQTYFYAPWREVNYYTHTNVWIAETEQLDFGTIDPEELKIQHPIWMSLEEIIAEIEAGKDNPEMNGYPVMNMVVDYLTGRKTENLPMIDKVNEWTKELFIKKPKVLLIHGRENSSLDGGCLNALETVYREKGYEVYFPDLTFAQDQDFSKAMDDISKYHADIVIGHSTGGYLAMQYASKHQSCQKLLLIASTLDTSSMKHIQESGSLGFESERVFKFHETPIDLVALQSKEILCIYGGQDRLIDSRFQELTKKKFPKAQCIILEQHGHMGSDEENKDYNDLIGFLNIEDRKNSFPTTPIYKRECDTLDTFMCSSFYFLRFPDAHNPDALIRKELADKMFPVDLYTGGKEHTVGHLLYSRFIHKFLYDQGYVNCREPFAKLVHQGMILGSDGRKMGKRYGNVIDPLDVIAQYGSDAVRTYLMFMGPVEQEKIRNDNALKGIKKFLDRIERACLGMKTMQASENSEKIQKSLESLTHKTIKAMTHDLEQMKYNTAVSKLMILLNAIEDAGSLVPRAILEIYLHLLVPFAPKIAQDIWAKFGQTDDLTTRKRPSYDPAKVVDDKIIVPVQINGKRRLELTVPADADETVVMDAFRETEDFGKYIGEQTIKKVIYVKGKILNVVI